MVMKNYYQFNASKNDDAADFLVYGPIGSQFENGISAKNFATDLQKVKNVKTINVRINSPGGSAFDGQAIYSLLKSHRAHINVYIDGLAASAASVVAMAGNTVMMPRNAIMMVHDAFSIVIGNAEDMRKEADTLDKIKLSLIAAYETKSNLHESIISSMMSAETWLTADEALDLRFVDVVTEEEKAVASCNFNFLKFTNTPISVLKNFSTSNAGQQNLYKHELRRTEMNNQQQNISNSNTPFDQKVKIEWDKSTDIQDEFLSYDDYVAFRKNEEKTAARRRR